MYALHFGLYEMMMWMKIIYTPFGIKYIPNKFHN